MEYKISESEYRFLCILWDAEPIESPELVKLCLDKLGWKKSTTYTVIKNLSEKDIVRNENMIVTTLVGRDEVNRQESRNFLEKNFKGDVVDLFATFLKDRKLTQEEAKAIKKMIEGAK